MAGLELLECAGCGLLKVRQDLAKSYRLCSPAISVGGAALAHKTIVCGGCSRQTRAGAGLVQLRASVSRSAARHALQTCPPGVLLLEPWAQKPARRHAVLLSVAAGRRGRRDIRGRGAAAVRWPRCGSADESYVGGFEGAELGDFEGFRQLRPLFDHLADGKNVELLIWGINQDDPVRVDPELKDKLEMTK
jgi:hypothetical protein